MKKHCITLSLLLFGAWQIIAAQSIEIKLPKLGGRSAWFYSFTGNKVDSFDIKLDAKGTAKFAFPKKNYRGMAYFYVPQAGGMEVIIGEPQLQIAGNEESVHYTTVQYPQSKENAYLTRIFQRRSYLLSQQEWLKAGEQYLDNKDDKAFAASLTTLLKENEKAVKLFDDSVKTSPLYAARFMELTLFMQRLYQAVQKPDSVVQKNLQNEMQYRLDINALYTSGNLWTDVQTYYGGLFTQGESNEANDRAYAASVEKTLMRLQEPVRTAFFVAAATAADRNNRPFAVEQMAKDFLRNYPDTKVEDEKLQRILNVYRVEKGNIAPALAGLSKPITQPAILIFFDSNCDHCRHELDWLIEHFSEMTAKGYRIISIAADTQQGNYLNAAAAFPWAKDDRLCDYKGFSGENFKNYGIIGTPTIFQLDKTGKILGKFAKMEDIER
ncbi:MAG: redoxin domain-containing protein [Prevotellaceae bacterium]|jgi:hypothetical protein|nr:redoxin domain-containing protein [Prevotellaceae bacterium]